jgi:hypothetical protein
VTLLSHLEPASAGILATEQRPNLLLLPRSAHPEINVLIFGELSGRSHMPEIVDLRLNTEGPAYFAYFLAVSMGGASPWRSGPSRTNEPNKLSCCSRLFCGPALCGAVSARFARQLSWRILFMLVVTLSAYRCGTKKESGSGTCRLFQVAWSSTISSTPLQHTSVVDRTGQKLLLLYHMQIKQINGTRHHMQHLPLLQCSPLVNLIPFACAAIKA